jgi:hypothetical protein
MNRTGASLAFRKPVYRPKRHRERLPRRHRAPLAVTEDLHRPIEDLVGLLLLGVVVDDAAGPRIEHAVHLDVLAAGGSSGSRDPRLDAEDGVEVEDSFAGFVSHSATPFSSSHLSMTMNLPSLSGASRGRMSRS